MKPKSRHKIKKSEVKRLVEELRASLNLEVSGFLAGKTVETAEFESHTVLLVEGKPAFFFLEDRVIPTLRGVMDLGIQQSLVVVDSGAVRFLANGADVMGPGIIRADEGIKTGDIVIIIEERHGKPLAIGKALKDGVEMPGSAGKAIKSLHYVGDKIWNLAL